MILLNLLPHREAARKRRRESFHASLGLSVVVGLVIVSLIFLWYQGQISAQQARNQFLQMHVKRLDAQIKDIANLQAEISALRARQQAVEDLQADRNLPVHLLNALIEQLPDGVHFTAIKQDGQSVMLQGIAQSNERVSEFMRNLAHSSPWIARPELVETQSANAVLGPRDHRKVMQFSMRVGLNRASEVPGPATSAPVASKKS